MCEVNCREGFIFHVIVHFHGIELVCTTSPAAKVHDHLPILTTAHCPYARIEEIRKKYKENDFIVTKQWYHATAKCPYMRIEEIR